MPKGILAALEPCDVQSAFSDLRALWSDLKGLDPVPRRRAFKPESLWRWLPSIIIVDFAEARYRFRLVGTAVVAAAGRDMTGLYFDEVVGPMFYSNLVRPYRRAAESAAPIEDSLRLDPILGSSLLGLSARRLILPCSKGGGPIDTFVACVLAERQVAA